MVEVVPAVIGALGSVTKGFGGWIEKLQITNNVGMIQKTALLGTARILKKCWRCKEEIILLRFGHLL